MLSVHCVAVSHCTSIGTIRNQTLFQSNFIKFSLFHALVWLAQIIVKYILFNFLFIDINIAGISHTQPAGTEMLSSAVKRWIESGKKRNEMETSIDWDVTRRLHKKQKKKKKNSRADVFEQRRRLRLLTPFGFKSLLNLIVYSEQQTSLIIHSLFVDSQREEKQIQNRVICK